MATKLSPALIEDIKAFKRRENIREIKEKRIEKKFQLQDKEAFI